MYAIRSYYDELTNFTDDDFINKNIDVIFKDTSDKISYDNLSTEESSINELWIKTATNKKIHVEVNSKKLDEKTFISIIRNLSERDNNIKELQKAKDKNNALLEAFPDEIYIVNRNGFV